MGSPVVHFEVGGKNSSGLQKFYAKNFGWKIDAKNPMNYGVVATGADKGIAGGISPANDEGPAAWVTFYIEVPRIDPVLKQITKSGGKIVVPRTAIPDMVTFAQFQDPEGNLVGLVEPAPPPAPKPKAAKPKAKQKKTRR